MDEGLVAGARARRVFELARMDGDLEIELPPAWARTHARAEVSLTRSDDFGWKAVPVGDDDARLLGFPWHDHVDRNLLCWRWLRFLPRRPTRALPVDLSSGAWDDLEQGWWGSVIPAGEMVFIAEADFDELCDVRATHRVVHVRPGVVGVDGVDIHWNVVPRSLYDDAWARAVASLGASR
jgi:hypothetical protein